MRVVVSQELYMTTATADLPLGWAWTGPFEATLSTGQPYDIMVNAGPGKPPKKIGVGWEITIKVTVSQEGIEVDADDCTRDYTHGSCTTADIPWTVLRALIARWDMESG